MKQRKGYRQQKGTFASGTWLKKYNQKIGKDLPIFKIITEGKDLEPEFSKTVTEHFWELA